MNEDRMTPEALAEIEGLAAAATEGTWVVDKMGRFEDHDECRISLPDDEIELCRYENADFIVASRLAVPQMAAEIRRAWAENARLRAELEAITKQINRVRSCKMCAHHKSDVFENPCAVCNMIVKQNFEWARPCLTNTPAQGETDEPMGGGEGEKDG